MEINAAEAARPDKNLPYQMRGIVNAEKNLHKTQYFQGLAP